MRFFFACSVAVLALVSGEPTARADVFIRAPFVTVQVGQPGVYVNVLGRTVAAVPNVSAVMPPPAPNYRRKPEVLPAPTPLKEIDSPIPTVAQFIGTFRPRSGRYKVVVVHPVTGRPVIVRFRLPAGSPAQVRLNRRQLEFDYGSREVAIRFLRNGRVRVLYD